MDAVLGEQAMIDRVARDVALRRAIDAAQRPRLVLAHHLLDGFHAAGADRVELRSAISGNSVQKLPPATTLAPARRNT